MSLLFKSNSNWSPPDLSSLPDWSQYKRIAIDLETRDEMLTKLGIGVRRGAYIIGVSFAIEFGPAFYLPIRHASGGNLDVEQTLQYLRDQAKVFRGELVGANLGYDLDFLLEAGIDFQPKFFRDVQIAEPLIDELQFKYSLNAIAARRGLPGKDETHLEQIAKMNGLHPKNDMWRLPASDVGPYAEQDARLPLQILRLQMREIDDQDLWQVFDLESRLLPVLVKMRRRGVRIDFDQLDYVEKWSLEEELKSLAEITRLSGIKLSPEDTNRARSLAPALERAGVVLPRTAKTNMPQITNAILENMQDNPVAKQIIRARKFNKLRTTFVSSIRRYEINGRIHCTFHQIRGEGPNGNAGTRSGRLSSSDPNLQQQPARDKETAAVWRAIYIPEEGCEWYCMDYSQQEPRWLTHYAELTNCRGAAAAAEQYRRDPTTDNHQMMADLTGLPRKQAKQLFLGICYGMGGAKLCRSLNLPVEQGRHGYEIAGPEGQRIIDKFRRRVPYVFELDQLCKKQVRERGYIKTVLGRRRRFPKNEKGSGFNWEHKALNSLIQGSSADQIKKAMVEADAAGIPLQLQVHDELDLSISDPAVAKQLEEIMLNCVKCNVPMKVDVEKGPNWGSIK